MKSIDENRRGGIRWSRERHGWKKADGPAIVSDLIVGEKTSQMWREKNPAQYRLRPLEGKG